MAQALQILFTDNWINNEITKIKSWEQIPIHVKTILV